MAKKLSTIVVSKDTLARLKKNKLVEGELHDSVINRALDALEKVKP